MALENSIPENMNNYFPRSKKELMQDYLLRELLSYIHKRSKQICYIPTQVL